MSCVILLITEVEEVVTSIHSMASHHISAWKLRQALHGTLLYIYTTIYCSHMIYIYIHIIAALEIALLLIDYVIGLLGTPTHNS
jgi:hypothetical protein